MTKFNVLLAGAAFVLALNSTVKAEGEPKAIQVEKVAVGTAIDNRELQGEAKEFDGSVSRLYGWTQISAEAVPTKIKHLWYADGAKEAEVPLDVKYPSTRTWSSKNVWPGSWKVEVSDEAGEVLASEEFTVRSRPAGEGFGADKAEGH